MIQSLTFCITTARRDPKIGWTLDSLHRELGGDYSNTKIVVIDTYADDLTRKEILNGKPYGNHVQWIEPKPTIWAGKHRITKEDWWSKCNSLNSCIAVCDTAWISFCDDRSVLSHGWLQCVQDSMIHGYAVCGSYEKRANMKVVNGEIVDEGQLLGKDIRTQRGFPHRTADWYGGSGALPLEWCLQVNGFPEDITDGLGFEDIAFGILLRNNHLEVRYDSRMKIIEDRTPSEIDGALKRASKPSPDPENKFLAKDYRILDIMNASTTSQNSYDIKQLREKVLSGESFPPSTASHFDWFDNQPVSEMI